MASPLLPDMSMLGMNAVLAASLLLAGAGHAAQSSRELVEIARFTVPEARQGVAVDAQHFYAVTDRGFGKYVKDTGVQVAKWEGPLDGPIIHFDSGVIVEGKLYAAHSNYPLEPMTSSVEIYDAATLKHVGTHSFGIMWGSLTWVDRHEGAWWAVFANYSRVGPDKRPDGNNYRTTLVKLDDKWQWQQAWVFPTHIMQRSEPRSISGGSWGPDAQLYVTGHDHSEVYVMRLPRAGSVLEHVETIPFAAIHGQGIAWDRSRPGILYGISRANKYVVAGQLRSKGAK